MSDSKAKMNQIRLSRQRLHYYAAAVNASPRRRAAAPFGRRRPPYKTGVRVVRVLLACPCLGACTSDPHAVHFLVGDV